MLMDIWKSQRTYIDKRRHSWFKYDLMITLKTVSLERGFPCVVLEKKIVNSLNSYGGQYPTVFGLKVKLW